MSQRRGHMHPNFGGKWLNWLDLVVGLLNWPKSLDVTKQASERGYGKPMRMNSGGGKPDAPLTTAERPELAQLRRQLRQITLERDILAKATAWFAHQDSGIDKTPMR